ncbi:hypothetical protein KP509_20G014200 [Ceratopteris richardii]|uniref:Uncharacterized protein n=1 Tax=Ceratopteris richardii TaxID=49495 RepID=A0A8T2SDY0_CERRI|nr:hypothetical protein KP509_20G014200 [Ceratopteris richardii]
MSMEARPSPVDEAPPETSAPDSLASPGNPFGDGGPVVCLVTGIRDAFAGGVMGSVFGFGQGIWKRQGFKGSLKEAGSSAKMFALLSGVHTLVTCCLRKIRGKQDAINAGIAGCATGLVLSTPGTPDTLLRSCVTFAAFSYIIERFGRPPAAIASSLDYFPVQQETRKTERGFSLDVLPPFVLPPLLLSNELSSRLKLKEYTNLRNW